MAKETAARSRGGGRMVLVLTLCCFVFGCAYQYILGVPDQVAATADIDLSQVSVMVAVYSLANGIGTPLMVVLLSRFGQKRVLLVGLAIMAVGMALVAATPNFAVMLVGRCIMGVGNGTFTSTAYVVASRVAGPGHGASAMANVALGFSASFVLALPAARALRDVVDWQVVYFLLAAAAAVAFAVIARSLRLPDEPRAAGEGASKAGGSFAVLRDPRVVLALACTVLVFVGYGSLNTYITPFMEFVLPDPALVSGALLAFGLMSLVGSKASGWAADRFGSGRAVVGGLVLHVSMLLAVGATVGAAPAAFAFCCLWQGASWGFLPAQNSLMMLLAGDRAAFAVSLSNSALQLGSSLGAFASGACIAALPLGLMPFVAAVGVALALGAELAALKLPARRCGAARVQ